MSDPNHSPDQSQEVYDLIDGATGDIQAVASQLSDLVQIIKSSESTLDEKIETYEDIIDSEVGDTNMVRARNLEREYGIRQLYLKFEGGNPTGTHKDRIAFAQCMDAMRRGFDVITVATCGNYGVAVAFAASLTGLKCIIYIPENYHTRRTDEMRSLGAEIIRAPGDYESAVGLSQNDAVKFEYYDANPGGQNTILQLKAYGEIAYEIYDQLHDAPRVLACPVSNGTVLAGIHKGFLSLYKRGKTSRIPRMVAGSSYGKNPIIQAFIHNKDSCEDLVPEKIKETKINEPLINWHSFDGDYALWSVRQSKGWAADASDKSMKDLARIIRDKEGISVLPASTAGLVSLIKQHQKEPLGNDRYVVILTGRK
ncbi:MAG: pyridoxal-phosphate dependent enzyme [Bacteroidetes bacterium]|nr:pyridoxal-phosphate dependent enzyme [Bacteroidota bacterium]